MMRAAAPGLALLLAGCGWTRLCLVDCAGPDRALLATRAVQVMNFAVTYCGFQPEQGVAEAVLAARLAWSDESVARAVCDAVAPRGLIVRGTILPEVDGVPIRGRWVR